MSFHTGKGGSEVSCYRDMISEISLKGRADSTEACTLNATRVEDKVSQIKHIIIGKKQWTRDIEAKRRKINRVSIQGHISNTGTRS